MSDLIFLSAVLMAEQVRKKKISPVELVDAHLAQIERLNPKLNAFVHVDAERARRAAQDAEKAVMHEKTLGPLHGVPISIKNSVAVEGMLCESGTRLRAGFTPTRDAPLVARLRAAGAIVLGVTNTPAVWPNQQSMGSGTHSRRLKRRRGRGNCCGHVCRRRGQRRRRFDSRAGALQWHLWLETDAGANSRNRPLSRLRGTFRLDRCCRSDGAHGCRFESSVRGDARA
jgi:hypothetical protein